MIGRSGSDARFEPPAQMSDYAGPAFLASVIANPLGGTKVGHNFRGDTGYPTDLFRW